MQVILSVIIPIFKVESYLESCINSVIKQDFTDIEVILVDDGSPDRCPEICDNFAIVDKRIKVIHQSNAGLSSARNAGLEIATGKYVIFLDSDDKWVEGRLKSIMLSVCKYDVDMVFIKSLSCQFEGALRERIDNDFFNNTGILYSRTELYPLLISEGNMREQAGTHICKTSFLKENQLFFQKGILGEDMEWMFRIMRVASKMVIIDEPLQIYTSTRPGSITNSIRPKTVEDLITVIRQSLEYHRINNSDVKRWELAQCAFLWSTALGYCSMLDKKTRNRFKPELKNLYNSLPICSHPKTKIVNIFYSMFGFSLTSLLLKLFMTLRKRNIIPQTKEI